MQSFIIEGGHPLSGTITPQGAKNEALQVICATLLTAEPVIIRNIPDILDVNNLIQLLRDIKVKVTQMSRNDYQFQADAVDLAYLESDEFVRKCAALRGSVLMMGPLLARFGKAVVAADSTPISSASRNSVRSSCSTSSATSTKSSHRRIVCRAAICCSTRLR